MKPSRVIEAIIPLIIGALLVGIAGGAYFVTAGVSARPTPGRAETLIARTIRHMAIAWHTDDIKNPVPPSEAVIAEGRAHFADHCAACHGNDGSGDTEMGRGLYPKAPDMRAAATQALSDAELFYIIENGVRLTGMPAWSTGTVAGEEASWHLVHFIRHLPQMTEDEVETMKALNPRSPDEIRQEIEAERFLRGEDPAPAAQPSHGDAHPHE